MALVDEALDALERARGAEDAFREEMERSNAFFNRTGTVKNGRGIEVYSAGEELAVSPRDRINFGAALASQRYWNAHEKEICAAISFDADQVRAAESALTDAIRIAQLLTAQVHDQEAVAEEAAAAAVEKQRLEQEHARQAARRPPAFMVR